MKRVLYVDILNIIACAGVLLLHSTNGPVHNFNGNVNFDWFIGLFSHSFFLWPVNVFFMLSGITMMRTCYEMTCKGEIKQYYLKTFESFRLSSVVVEFDLLTYKNCC